MSFGRTRSTLAYIGVIEKSYDVLDKIDNVPLKLNASSTLHHKADSGELINTSLGPSHANKTHLNVTTCANHEVPALSTLTYLHLSRATWAPGLAGSAAQTLEPTIDALHPNGWSV